MEFCLGQTTQGVENTILGGFNAVADRMVGECKKQEERAVVKQDRDDKEKLMDAWKLRN